MAEEAEFKDTQPTMIKDQGIPYGEKVTENISNVTAPKLKKQRAVSIKTINTEATWQLETADDVERYVSELERKLLNLLEDDTIFHVEF